MKEIATILGFFIILALVIALGWGLGWFGLITGRPMAKYQAETQRQVYQNSIARQQGANNGIGQDCANMQSNTGPQQKAFARFVLTDAAAYSGDQGLSPQSAACISQAREVLAQ